VCRGASIGTSTTILSNVTIGRNAIIGAGSVVTRDIPDNVVAAGNPCRVLRPLGESE
jgi:acetyltransferase-like isoleucine patch superfamily enzyme